MEVLIIETMCAISGDRVLSKIKSVFFASKVQESLRFKHNWKRSWTVYTSNRPRIGLFGANAEGLDPWGSDELLRVDFCGVSNSPSLLVL